MQYQLGVLGTISAFAYRHREKNKPLCRGGLSQELSYTEFQPAIRQLKYVRQQFTRSKTLHKGSKHTHKVITQNIKDKLQSAAKNKENNTMGRKYCTQLLILLLHRYNTPILIGRSLYFISPTINTLHGTPRFTSSQHCTSLHFTARHYLNNLNSHFLQFTTLITILTLFLKAFGLQGRVPKISAGNLFQRRRVLFTRQYFPISVLCILFLIFRS